jgi:hypothetical protein
MICHCKCFQFVNGILVCSVCGKPSTKYPGNRPKVEDKMVDKSTIENKNKTKSRR